MSQSSANELHSFTIMTLTLAGCMHCQFVHGDCSYVPHTCKLHVFDVLLRGGLVVQQAPQQVEQVELTTRHAVDLLWTPQQIHNKPNT